MKLNKILQYYEKYINPEIKKHVCLFSHSKDIFLRGKGVYIFTEKQKKILDITGGIGVLNLGHNHSEIIKERIKFQKKLYLEVHKDILSRHVAKLAKTISDVLPKDLTASIFSNSGADANDGAIKTAYKYHNGKRKYILCSNIGFHGRSITTASITGSLKNKYFPNALRSKTFIHNSLQDIKKIINENLKKFAHTNIFAIIVEPYNHIHVTACDYKFLKGIRRLCNKHKIILIYDEIYTGWGKTGTLFYFMRHKDICPDILTTSKSLGGGKASVAAYIMKRKILMRTYGNTKEFNLPLSTFNGFGEECVTATKAIKILKKKKFCQYAKNIEKIVNRRFRLLSKKYPEYRMKIKGCGALQKIFFDNFNLVQTVVDSKLKRKEKKMISSIKNVILESSILDELYFKYRIWAFQSLSKIVVSPALIIKPKELNYFFNSLEKILFLGPEKIIRNYINRLTK